MDKALHIFEFSYAGRPALWFYSCESGSYSTDEPYGRPYALGGKVGRAFAQALEAMRVWVERGGDLESLPRGWSLLETVAAVDVELALAPCDVMH